MTPSPQKTLLRIRALFDTDPEACNLHPGRDWSIMLAATFVGLALCLGFELYLFSRAIAPIEIDAAAIPAERTTLIDARRLRAVIVAQEGKRVELERLRKERPRIVDPSL